MTDITERLNGAITALQCENDQLRARALAQSDEIESLRAAIERQRGAARTIMIHEAGELRALRAKRVEWHAATSTLDSEREANAILTAENERLRAALAFYADEANWCDAACAMAWTGCEPALQDHGGRARTALRGQG